MISRDIHVLLPRSKTITHLLQLHSLLLKTAIDHDSNFVSLLISSSCSISITFARQVLDKSPILPPVFAWNSLIRSFTKSSNPIESIKLLSQMLEAGLKPDNFTYPFVLKASGMCSMISHGGAVHSMSLKVGFELDRYIGNTLLRMYAACGQIGFARRVFDEMLVRDVVSWSSLIAGYDACNCPWDAFKMFQQMKLANVKPNSVTFVSFLSACTRLLDLSKGKSIHSYLMVNSMELDVALGTALLLMYSKCGQIEEAIKIFNSMNQKNLQAWTVMIAALADHSRGDVAISLFIQMQQSGLKPDSKLFSGILSACSHTGLVDEARRFFDQMERFYNIKPTMEHYGCMVDLFGRAGLIEEAYGIIRNMPMDPNAVILRSFLGACRNHAQVVRIDDNLRRLLLKLEPELGSNYVLAASVSCLSGSWNDAAKLRDAMKQKGLKKVPGCSWIE